MDIRKPCWHGQLSITGIGAPINHSGSVLSIVGEMLKNLNQLNPRALASGEKEIIIRIGTKPYGDSKADNASLERVLEVEARLDTTQVEDGPREGEHYDDYVQRLVDNGTPTQAAMMIAADWYPNHQPPEGLIRWLTDPKAVRFRALNSSASLYESASPQEYAQLKTYVLDSYAEFCRTITFRTA